MTCSECWCVDLIVTIVMPWKLFESESGCESYGQKPNWCFNESSAIRFTVARDSGYCSSSVPNLWLEPKSLWCRMRVRVFLLNPFDSSIGSEVELDGFSWWIQGRRRASNSSASGWLSSWWRTRERCSWRRVWSRWRRPGVLQRQGEAEVVAHGRWSIVSLCKIVGRVGERVMGDIESASFCFKPEYIFSFIWSLYFLSLGDLVFVLLLCFILVSYQLWERTE